MTVMVAVCGERKRSNYFS